MEAVDNINILVDKLPEDQNYDEIKGQVTNHKQAAVKSALAIGACQTANSIVATSSFAPISNSAPTTSSPSCGDDYDLPTIPDSPSEILKELGEKIEEMEYGTADPMDFAMYLVALQQKESKLPPKVRDVINNVLKPFLQNDSLAIQVAMYIRDEAFFSSGSTDAKDKAVTALNNLIASLPEGSSLASAIKNEAAFEIGGIDKFAKDNSDPATGLPNISKDLAPFKFQGDFYTYLQGLDISKILKKIRQAEIALIMASTHNGYLLIMLLFQIMGGYGADLQYQVGGQGKLADKMRGLGDDVSKLLDDFYNNAPPTGGNTGTWDKAKAKDWLQRMNNIMYKVAQYKKEYGDLPSELQTALSGIYNISGKTDDGTTRSIQDCLNMFKDAKTPADQDKAMTYASEIMNGVYPDPTSPTPVTPPGYQTTINNLKQMTDLFSNQSQVVGTATQRTNDRLNTVNGFIKTMSSYYTQVASEVIQNIRNQTNS